MTVQARGITAVVTHLEAMQARMRDLSPVLEVAASDTVAVIDDAFESGVSPGGLTWAPLLPSTLAKRRNGSSKPLNDTLRLRNSANSRVEGSRLLFGTSASYGLYHQAGTRQIVPRPFLPVTGEPGAYDLGATGAAGAHWARVRAAVKHYILTGEVR
jgi:phage gpG-like protein